MRKLIISLSIFFFFIKIGYSQKTSDLNKDRSYDEISWLITHNAFQNPEIGASDAGPGGKNQQHSINTQLDNGVRSFMIDLQYGRVSNVFKGSFLHLGHGAGGYFHWMEMCDFLEDIKLFLDENRDEVITLHMQVDNNVTVSHINEAFNGAGNQCNSRADIDHYLYSQPFKNKRWPSLNSLIQTNKRLIVFSEKNFGNNVPSWLHYEFEYTHQNDYSANQVVELLETHRYDIIGNPARGDNRSSLLTINNFVTDTPLGYGDGNKSADANNFSKMKTKLIGSWFSFSKRPSMAVDFYEKNDYSSNKVIMEANKWNEVRGRFKYIDESDFNDYVITNSNIPGENPWYQQGAKTKARLYYSFPARADESRIVKFYHPDYTFTPEHIKLNDYNGNIGKTFIQDILVTPKSLSNGKDLLSYEKAFYLTKKSKNLYTLEFDNVYFESTEFNIYDLMGRLIHNIGNRKQSKINFELPQSGIYIIQSVINGKFYSKKFVND